MIAGRRQNIRRMKEAFREHGRKQRHVFIQTISPWALLWVSVWMMEIKALSLSADLWRTHGHKSLNRKTSTTIKTTEETSGASKHQERAPEEESNSSSFLHMKLLLLHYMELQQCACHLPTDTCRLLSACDGPAVQTFDHSLYHIHQPGLNTEQITGLYFIKRGDYKVSSTKQEDIRQNSRRTRGGNERGIGWQLQSKNTRGRSAVQRQGGKESPPAGSYQDFAFQYLTFF